MPYSILSKTYGIEDVEKYGIRLYFNTFLNGLVNCLAAYLILKHSTEAMKIYKFFLFLTLLGAFILDFQVSFIYGMFALFPTPIICAAGIAKNWGWFWGSTVNYAITHIAFSFAGMALFYGIFFQYVSLVRGDPEALAKPWKRVGMIISMILYGCPPAMIGLLGADREGMIEYVKSEAPNVLELFTTGACAMSKYYGLTIYLYVGLCLAQISFVFMAASFMVIKIFHKLKMMKSSMSASSLKAHQQFIAALIVQMSLPFFFFVLPVSFLMIYLVLGKGDIAELSQWMLQWMGFHSSANGVAIITIIKPYRMKLKEWCQKIKRLFFCQQNHQQLRRIDAGATTTQIFSLVVREN